MNLFEWIASGLMTALVTIGFILFRRLGTNEKVLLIFSTAIDTALLGLNKTGGLVQKVDYLMGRDAAADKALEVRFKEERHNMRDEIETIVGKVEDEMKDGFKRIEDKLDRK